MRFWISRGRGGGKHEGDVFFEPKRPLDNTLKFRWVCYREWLAFTRINLRPGHSIEIRTGRRLRWQAR